MRKRLKYLLKNILYLLIGSFGSKILVFLLVPLYTSVLTTSEYGIFDLFVSTVNVLIPLLTLNIMESVLRFSIDLSADTGEVFSVGVKYTSLSIVPISLALIANHYFLFNKTLDVYWYWFLLLYITHAYAQIFLSYARGIGQIKDVSISGFLCSLTLVVSNIYFLLNAKWGLNGYFLANIISALVQILYLFYRTHCYSKIRLFGISKQLEAGMIRYSTPLIANSIAWWVNNLSDRYIISALIGVSENGIYSVASKIPTILSVFQTIFQQAWTLSAVQEFDENDSNGFFSKTYGAYGFLMVSAASVLILFDKLLAHYLYSKDFFQAWRYVPFLLISVVFGALSGFIGGVFSAVKDSKIFAKSTMYGAGINTIMNFMLVPVFGAMGAAFATMTSYFLVWCIRLFHMRKYIKVVMNLKRDIASYVLLLIQSIVLIFSSDSGLQVCVLSMITFVIVLLYREEALGIIKMIKPNRTN